MRLLLANPDQVYFMGTAIEETNFNGKAGLRYNLMLQGSLDLGSVICTKEAYDQASTLKRNTPVNIIGDYSSQFKSFRVTNIKPTA